MANQTLGILKKQGYITFNIYDIEQRKEEDVKTIGKLEQNILSHKLEAECIVDTKSSNAELFTLSNIKSELETAKSIINQQDIRETIKYYLECEEPRFSQEIFWRNPGGLPITPHQDTCYTEKKHLSVIIPLTETSSKEGALQYAISSESEKYKHEFSIRQHQYYAKGIEGKKFIVPYQREQVIIHTPTSLHKARNPKKGGKRGIYIRLIVY
jgi:hypothetical protein